MQIGVFAKTFAGSDPATVLAAARAAGYRSVQYNMACSGLPSMPDTITREIAAEVVNASRNSGVKIAAVSGTYNMIHPDLAQRALGQTRLAVLIKAASALGTPMVTLCTGTRDPHDQWSGHPDNTSPQAWRELLTEMAQAADLAERHNVRLGIEPELANVVDSATRARQLIDEIASPSLAIVLDPANLFEIATPDQQRALVEQAVDLLGDRIVMAHAKDRDAQGGFATAGQGVVDFAHFIRTLRRAGFDDDLVTHGLTQAEAPAVAAFLAQLLAQT